MENKEPKQGSEAQKSGASDSEKKGYGAYQKEIKGGNIGPLADEAATGDSGIAIGGGLGVGRNSVDKNDNDDEVNEEPKHPNDR